MRNLILFLTIFILFSFSGKEEPICKEEKLFEKASFPVGTALNTDKLKYEEKYWITAMAQFNSFTPERIMKPQYLHPQIDRFDFNEVDHLVEFCKKYKLRLHGHTLVWHKSLPVWMDNFTGSKEQWETMYKDHITKIVSHCKGRIKSWDVVNEAFNDDGTLRKNIWLKNIGESYIEKAFVYASEADPDAKLFYNDYSIELPGAKLDAVLRHMTNIRGKGIKIDGIGLQMHVTLAYPDISAINQATQRIQKEGFAVHYSELDVRLNVGTLFFSKKKLYAMQKARIKEIVQGYMKLDSASRFGITMWGVGDNDSWLTEESIRARPLLYNTSYKIKPAYCGFIEGLQ